MKVIYCDIYSLQCDSLHYGKMHSGLRLQNLRHVSVSSTTQIFDFGKSPNPQVFCFFCGMSSKVAWMMSWHPTEAMRQ